MPSEDVSKILRESLLFLFDLAWWGAVRVPLVIGAVFLLVDVNLRVELDINEADRPVAQQDAEVQANNFGLAADRL